MKETALAFQCEGSWLYGVLHHAAAAARRGVLIVVGGPQYRIGSHRQFLLLARRLAKDGVPVMRFDYRGMGDAQGEGVGFERAMPDIRAAIDEFLRREPTLSEIVIWGLCDAASAALLYAPSDARVRGVALLNPWVRTERSEAQTYLRHYYVGRLFERELWAKIVRGNFDFKGALQSFWLSVKTARRAPAGDTAAEPYPARMLRGLQAFDGAVLVILSGDDLTASEFKDLVAAAPAWREALARPRVAQQTLAPSNHTFARRDWRAQVEDWTREWLRSW